MKTNYKEIVRLLIEEVFNQGNIALLQEIVHPQYRYQSPTESMQGLEELAAFVIAFRSAFPDIAVFIKDQLADGDRVCSRIVVSGTHRGDFLGLPATGKEVSLEGIVLSRFEDGLIKEEWELLDQLTLLQQLGIVRNEAA